MSSRIPERADAGPREPLSRERIVAAAIAVLDAEGLAALTMRRVAEELDAGVMSLYRHVAGRDELLDLVLDTIGADVPFPQPTGDWRGDAAAVARAIRWALLRRRDLTLLLTARLGRGPAALGWLDATIGIFLAGGFSAREAVLANHALGAYVAGSCTWDAVGLDGLADPAARAARAAQAAARLADVSGEVYPNVAAVRDELFAGTSDDRFEAGLAALLAGFDARRGSARGAGA